MVKLKALLTVTFAFIVGSSVWNTRTLSRTVVTNSKGIAESPRQWEQNDKVGPKRPLATEGTPPQRCDYTFDDRINNTFYDHKCWRKYSVDDWRHREGGASRALFDHGAVYLKNILEHEEAKALREYLVGELSPKTLDGEGYYQGNYRNGTGRYDPRLDPRVQEPVLDALNKVVERLRPTYERALGTRAILTELSVFISCDTEVQKAHHDVCSFCCGIADSFKDRLHEVEKIDREKNLAVIKPSHYENGDCGSMYTTFIALQPTTLEMNGVTFVYPDSHRYFSWNPVSEREEMIDTILEDDSLERCEAPLNAGDGFMYNLQTLHGGNKNPTNSARMLLGVDFRSEDGPTGFPVGGYDNTDMFPAAALPAKEKTRSTKCSSLRCVCMGMNSQRCKYSSGKISLLDFPATSDEIRRIVAA